MDNIFPHFRLLYSAKLDRWAATLACIKPTPSPKKKKEKEKEKSLREVSCVNFLLI